MSSYTHARTASDVVTASLLGLPEQNANPPPSPGLESAGFSQIIRDEPDKLLWERKLGQAEVSYYLPSRAEGVNDMYLHLRLYAPPARFVPSRVLLVWALLRIRHPLLGSVVDQRALNDIYFVHELPRTTAEAIVGAKASAAFPVDKTKDELVDAFLNGPRTLSDKLLAKISISTPPAPKEGEKDPRDIFPNPANPVGVTGENKHFEFMFFAGHFLGDGVSFAVIANEFLTLIANDMTDEDLGALVQTEIDARVLVKANPIPVSTERRLAIPRSWGKFQHAIGQVEFMNNQARQIGGQAFPKVQTSNTRRTFVDTRVYDPKTTAVALQKCKSQGVTIAHAAFALVNIAWARRQDANNELPLMFYSAINLRGALRPPKPTASSFFHLCVGYFNVTLPSFLIPSIPDAKTFWLRCQSTKAQTLRAVKSKFLVTRALAMSTARERQAIGWAKHDDAVAAATAAKAKEAEGGVVDAIAEGVEKLKVGLEKTVQGNGNDAKTDATSATAAASVPAPKPAPATGKAPQIALMGLSFLGNLDAISNYTTYTMIHSSDLTFGVRQRPGGMLMFCYTFAGRLWFSLGWDKNGYPEGYVENFWNEVNATIGEFLG
ncbi:hypothetical protein [Phaffia rhodozyma]|uniref:Alcohol acetyltransferase n=1 Tax=Phaffia rhodozyma TaxID=264483 RepID=A0A0F7SLS1_PHARH|nr:hypothetical protein [Phaffia rhodozyma]